MERLPTITFEFEKVMVEEQLFRQDTDSLNIY